MAVEQIKFGRRSFIKSSVAAGGGLLLAFNWFAPESAKAAVSGAESAWFKINAYLKISSQGGITIMSPNPEVGQNIKTSMPMILAEELDANWKSVVVEQAPLDTNLYTRQLAGGSDSIRQSWPGLRRAGATARYMLVEAAARKWNVPSKEITVESGVLLHQLSGRKGHFGEFALEAAKIPVPSEVQLKDLTNFSIVGKSQKNVDGLGIVTGKPLFGLDYIQPGTLYATIAHPPAFGLRLKSFNATKAKAMPGIKDIFSFKTFNDDYKRQWTDTSSFTELIAVVGNSTWEVMNARAELVVEWEQTPESRIIMAGFRSDMEVNVPAGLESTADHHRKMKEAATGPAKTERRDGNPEETFRTAAKVIERIYTAPFIAHSPLEPLNFFADVTSERALLAGSIQSPEYMEKTLSARLGLPLEKIEIQMTRIGGGFGRKLYGHYLVEAAVISQMVKAPIKLIYSREEDMTSGVYRPMYHATYRAALDSSNNLIAFHVKMGGIPENALHANRFPAGAVDNYLAESWSVPSNISVGAMRAPGSNFNAAAEQSFLDEVAEAADKDPIQFRLDLLRRAKENPVGKNNDYNASRYAVVLELLREKSGWGKETSPKNRGVAAYFCHNSYSAQVVDVVVENGIPRVEAVCCTNDCGVVVNPDAAANMVEGSIVDGIGNAMYGELTFTNGKPDKSNFDRYRIIRHNEAPRKIDVHFVENNLPPSGLGEPPYPPVFAALANALYKATGKRYYHQPFIKNQF